MSSSASRPLETGWLADTPVDDSLLRRFLFNQAEVNEITATSLGGRADRTDEVFLADAATPVSYLNQAVLARPVLDAKDRVLDVVDRYFAEAEHPSTVLSIWPTPDLSGRGWSLVGHPAMVARAPGPIDHRTPPDVEIRRADSAEDLVAAERVVIDGYPMPEASGLPAGRMFPPALLGSGVVVRVGALEGTPVAVGNVHVGHGIVNLCLAATLSSARRRGVWRSLVWARVGEAPDLPAVAFTSDDSRPGFLAMGFLPLMRLTLWSRPVGPGPGR